MDKDYLKEKIKFNTELLRGFFVLLVLIGTGVTTLFVSESFSLRTFYRDIMIFGLYTVAIFLVIMAGLIIKINKLIKTLKL